MVFQKSPRSSSLSYKEILYIYCVLIFGIFAAINFVLKVNNYTSREELHVWDVCYVALTDVDLFSKIFSSAGLALSNLISIPLYLMPVKNIATPYLFSLTIFIIFSFFIVFFLRKYNFSVKKSLFLFSLSLFNIPSLFLLSSQPISILTTIFFILSIVSLTYFRRDEIVRAMMLLTMAFIGLFLSGEIGIAYAMTFFMLLPFLNYSQILRKKPEVAMHTLGVFILTIFFSIVYLSWLYRQDLESLFLLRLGESDKMAMVMVPLFFIHEWILSRRSENVPLGERYVVSKLLFFTLSFLFVFGWKFDIFSLFSIFLSLFYFRTIVNPVRFKRKLAVAFSIFVSANLLSIFAFDNIEFTKWKIAISESIYEYNHDDISALRALEMNPAERTLYLTHNTQLFTAALNARTRDVFPFTDLFTSISLNRLQSFDRLIVERPDEGASRSLLQYLQSVVYNDDADGFKVVYRNNNWKVLQRNTFEFHWPNDIKRYSVFSDISIFTQQIGIFLFIIGAVIYLIIYVINLYQVESD